MPSFRIKKYSFWRRRFLKVFTIYEHGGHIRHVTRTTYILSFSLPKEALLELSEEKMLEIVDDDDAEAGRQSMVMHVL